MAKLRNAREEIVAGEKLCCLVCDNQKFFRRNAQLNTAMATFFNFDWANKSALCLICDQCGYIHWFMDPK